MKMVVDTTRTRSKELDMVNNTKGTQSEVGVVDSQRGTLLPSEIFIMGERLLYETRPLLWPLLVRSALLTFVGIIIVVIAPQIRLEFMGTIVEWIPLHLIRSVVGWIGIILLLAGLLNILIKCLRWRYIVYTVTNRRILRQTGIVGKSYVDCSLSRVQNVYMDTTILGRIFGFGTVRVATAGTTGVEIHWKNVKEPMKVHREINEAIEQSLQDIEQSHRGEP